MKRSHLKIASLCMMIAVGAFIAIVMSRRDIPREFEKLPLGVNERYVVQTMGIPEALYGSGEAYKGTGGPYPDLIPCRFSDGAKLTGTLTDVSRQMVYHGSFHIIQYWIGLSKEGVVVCKCKQGW